MRIYKIELNRVIKEHHQCYIYIYIDLYRVVSLTFDPYPRVTIHFPLNALNHFLLRFIALDFNSYFVYVTSTSYH